MACMSPLSMLAVSMLDMAWMVYSLRELQCLIRGCLWMALILDHWIWFSEWIRFMKDLKYLQKHGTSQRFSLALWLSHDLHLSYHTN